MNDMSARRCKQGKNKIYIFSQKGAGFKSVLCKIGRILSDFPSGAKKGPYLTRGRILASDKKTAHQRESQCASSTSWYKKIELF